MTRFQIIIKTNKGKHLTYVERKLIAEYLKQGVSNREIARRLARAPQTINQEIKDGTAIQIRKQTNNGKVYYYVYEVYFPEKEQQVYESARENSGRKASWQVKQDFLDFAEGKIIDEHWSPAAVILSAKKQSCFKSSEIPSITTLYAWIDQGVGNLRNIYLNLKPKRKLKTK